MENYDVLFQPLKVGRHTLRNRIFMPACETRLSNPDGSSTREMADYYGERAKGGAALIIIENTFVDNKEQKFAGLIRNQHGSFDCFALLCIRSHP